MIIPYPALEQHLKKQCAPVYLVTGLDLYLFHQAVTLIKQAWKHTSQDTHEESISSVQQAADWAQSFQEANTYSLFSNHSLLDLRFDKKTLDAASKKHLQSYLEHPNPSSLVLIQAPSLPAKQVQSLVTHPNIVHTHITPLTPQAFKKFIAQRLQTLQLRCDSDVPDLIYQYHQANLLACSQFIEQLSLMHDTTHILDQATIMTYLRDQSEFTLYELGDACLSAQTTKAIHIFRQLNQAQTEPTLILWLLSQEVRKLIQLHHLLQSMSYQAACQQLKIWSQKTAMYQQASQRLSVTTLYTLLKICQYLDEQLKSNRSTGIWYELEQLILKIA
ncbi:MAG: DNA polymerase III subunit delta [Legionella sp.]|nr:MAG: DNA polymerase III subunit delta [Legionella sp.]